MKAVLRLIAAVAGFFALGLQFWLEVTLPNGPGLIASTVNFFSYFTILSNALAAFAMLLPVVAPRSAAGLFLSRPTVRTAIAGYLIIVGVIFFLLLRHLGSDHGLERIADLLLHYATPMLFMIDWLTFVPKGRIPWTMIGSSLVAPFLFGLWTTIHGAAANWYPYPFLDVARLGFLKTFMNMAGFVGVFIAVAFALVVTDRIVGSMRRPDAGDPG